MKNFVKENWYKLMIGTSMVIASSAMFIYSVNPSYAGTSNNLITKSVNSFKSSLPAGSDGKIMMESSTVLREGKIIFHILVWNTETGKSKMYNFSHSNNDFTTSTYQLPSSPLN